MKKKDWVSDHLPPEFRDALVEAAKQHSEAQIDQVTWQLMNRHPSMFRQQAHDEETMRRRYGRPAEVGETERVAPEPVVAVATPSLTEQISALMERV